MTANLLSNAGLPISEAMAFGIGGGLFFGFFPFIRVNNMPMMTYRITPGKIFKRSVKRLGGRYKVTTYRNAQKAEAELDSMIAAGIPVGVRVGLYWLPFVPPLIRQHFNAHHLIVYGKEGDEYLISDPLIPFVVRCHADDLSRARFAPGSLTPKGRTFRLTYIPKDVDWAGAIMQAIREVCTAMIRYPVPILGTRGMRLLASQIAKWPQRMDPGRAILHLGQVVRYQEEYGTGGAGFRFMYAAFLQEAGNMLKKPALIELSRDLTVIGDRWQEYAVLAARICKGRTVNSDPYLEVSKTLLEIAGREEKFFGKLWEASQ
jgi:hypothetical protein